MNKIKSTVIDTMITTGTSLVILAAFLMIFRQDFIDNLTVFQIFGANIVINCGLVLIHKIESRFVIVEYLIDVSYIIAVLVVFGAIFDWYSTVPVWLLAVMAVVIYIFMIIVTTVKIQKDTKKINALLQKRKSRYIDSAS